MHALSSYRINRPTPTHPQTGPITIHCAAKLGAQYNNVHTNVNVHKFGMTQWVQHRSVLFVFSIVNTVEKKSFNISALTLDLLDNSPWLSCNDPTFDFAVTFASGMCKKNFLSCLIFLASLDFKLFLSFFYRDFSLSLALDNVCRTNYGGRRRLPPDVGCTNYQPTAPTAPT